MFNRIYNYVGKYRLYFVLLVLILCILSIFRLITLSFSSNIDLMLPKGSEIARDIHFLQNSNLSDKVVISLKLNDSGLSQRKLIDAADELTRSLHSPYITEIVSNISTSNYLDETTELLNYAPQLITVKQLEKLRKRITPDGVKTALQNIYNQLVLSPGSSFYSSFICSDPLGAKMPILNSLKRLGSALGYKVNIVDGHLISNDGKHLLLILTTSVKITDMKNGRLLFSYLNKRLKQLPEYVTASIVCGHLHSISNEDIMKSDIAVIITIASVLFFLLFIFLFRSIRAVLVFVIPFIGIAISAGICSLFINNLALFVLGLGSVLAGIAIDYGIHVYIAVRTGGNSSENIKKVFKPLSIGALTTIGILASFFYSKIEGYHQLAYFSVIGLSICVLCSVFLLPHFLVDRREVRKFNSIIHSGNNYYHILIIICWTVLIIFSIFYSVRLKMDNDITQFDGSKSEIFKSESSFHKIWGSPNQTAILVVEADSLNEALTLNGLIYSKAINEIGKDDISSIAPLYPSKAVRDKNVKSWLKFWSREEEVRLKSLIRKYSPQFGFSPDAFSPFFKNLYKGTVVKEQIPEFMSDLLKRFIISNKNGYKILSFFPDTQNNVSIMKRICKDFKGGFIVSRKSMSNVLSETIYSEILYMSIIALFVIPILSLLLLRNFIKAFIALIPVFSGFLGILGMFSVFDMKFNIPGIISTVVILGLCIDYGIFMVYKCDSNTNTGTVIAVILSALTTLMGAVGLLFASHPILYYVGFTVVVGIFFGVITAILVVPAFYKLIYRKY